MFKIFLYYLFVFSTNFINSKCLKLEVNGKVDSHIAQKQLQQIYQQTKHMEYGKCWTDALQQLQTGCRQLTDETQRQIAYAFARCHLQGSGRIIPECDFNMDIKECTNENVLKDFAFNTYTEFFTHTQQICFHLQNQVWHEATELTISKLADNSAEVATSLEESSVIAREMVERQNLSLQNQEELLRNERMMRESMHKSVMEVQKSQEESKIVMREQKLLFAEVFDRVSALQKTILGEFSSIYTFGFYVGATILAYILTSTPRSSSARIWLFVLITFNFMTERAIVNYHLASSDESIFLNNPVLPEVVYSDLWVCRKVYCSVALLLMLICIVRYKDYGKLNNHLLNEIKRQNAELQQLLKGREIFTRETFFPKQIQGSDVCCDDIIVPTETQNGTVVLAKETTPDRDSCSVSSYHSESDVTYVANSYISKNSDSSFSSYATGCSSPALDSIPETVHSFIRSSTPSARSASRRSSFSSTASFNEKLTESVIEAQGVIIGGHNLRRRRQSTYKNILTGEESIELFMKSVAKVTAKRKKLLQK